MVSVSMQTKMALQSAAQLELIDRLRTLDIAKYVPLPQIAVVGDQSSGKSSVLESIFHISLPKDSGLCTRSATQFIFRRSPIDVVKISVQPGPGRDAAKAEELRAYRKEYTALTNEVFTRVLKEVCEIMGIPGPGDTLEDGQSAFSEDILTIETFGPNQQNLSMVDIPGIFREPEEGKTTEADIELVRRIMNHHISNDRTIILAVIPANVDVATQEILRIAKQCDPDGFRTLGVLTKPDLVDSGAEENVMRLVGGQSNRLTLGWCICRNRGQSELAIDSESRDVKEESFFANTNPWSLLDKSRVGTRALQQRLRDVLTDITRREYPRVKTQISQQLSERRKELKSLGLDRRSTDSQRAFLLEISRQYQDITNFALDASYSRSELFEKSKELRLSTLTVARNDRFAEEVRLLGHTVAFAGPVEDAEDNIPRLDPTAEKDLWKGFHQLSLSNGLSKYSELYELIDDCSTADLVGHKEDIMNWIEKEYKRGRGFEVPGLIGPSILPTMWKKQTQNWECLALRYVHDVLFSVHHFICKTLSHVCADQRIQENLRSAMEEQLLDCYKKAIEHCKLIVAVERRGSLLTVNHHHIERLRNCRANRLSKLLEPHATKNDWNPTSESAKKEKNPHKFAEAKTMISLDKVQQTVVESHTEQAIQDIHDILESYYKVARNRFVDTICMQVSDHHLLNGPASPLRILDTKFVSQLSAEQLDLIAGEDESTKQYRASLEMEIGALEEGRKLMNK